MLPIVLALLAALSWGFSAVLVRLGLRDISTVLGTLVSLATSVVFTALVVASFEREAMAGVSLDAVLLFGLIGIVNFPLGRFLNYLSMSHLGVGRSTPIIASSPLFAMVIAVVFTGERPQVATVGGTALILAGLLVTITSPPRKEDAHSGN